MGGLLQDNKSGSGSGVYGAKILHVGGFPYENTAAKFWTCLLDEVADKYPQRTQVILSAACSGRLAPLLLDPEQLLQRDMRNLETETTQQVLDDAIAVLELLGPPPGVRLRLTAGEEQAVVHEITLEDIDAELIPFLLAWLLEWARVPDTQWNHKTIRGAFAGEDRARSYGYAVAFELRNTLLGEELYEREVVIRCERIRAQVPVTGP